MLEIIFSFAAVFSLQFFLCVKARSRKIHFLPICVLSALACVLSVISYFIRDWDALAYIMFAVISGYFAAVCGIALVAYYAWQRYLKNKKEP